MLFYFPSQSSFQLLHIFTSVPERRMKLIFAAESYILQTVYSKARLVWIPEMAYIGRGPFYPDKMLVILILTSCFSPDAMRTQETHELVRSCTEIIWIPVQCLKNELIFLLMGQNLFVLLMCRTRKIITSQFSTRKWKARCFKASVVLQNGHRYRRVRITYWFVWRGIREMLSLFWHEKIQKLILKRATSSTNLWDNMDLRILGTYFCLYTEQSLTSMGFSPSFD